MQPNRARNRALLTGTGWTLAAAAALALFKSFPSEPIYLWSLGVVASGWAGVLLHALAAERRAAAASLAAVCCETGGMIDGLAQVIDVQMQRACGELARVDELLAHAVEQLMAAFNGVSEEAHRYQNELAQGTLATEGQHAAAGRVASHVNGAVTAMQFRDVAGQKLGHVRRELEALEQLMRRVREVSGAQSGPATVPRRAPAGGAARVQDLLRELELATAASPAQQELMHAGEVDLF